MEVYQFNVKDRYFLLDVPSSLLVETDPECFGTFGSCEMNQGAFREFEFLRKFGFFPDGPQPVLQELPQSSHCALYMDGIHACNLRCRYCYSGGGSFQRGKKMSFETARRAVDFLVKEFAPGAKTYHISLTAGGEALLNYELFKFLKCYCEEKSKEIGKPIGCGFGTNGVLLTSEIIREFSSIGQSVYISIDGPKEVHDAFRVFPDGRGSYDLILPRIREALSYGIVTGACATLTPLHTDFVGILEHLVGLGFKAVCMRPVRARPEVPYAITEENVDRMKEGYTELAEFLVEDLLGGGGYFFYLEPRDFLMRFFTRWLFRRKVFYRCESARSWLGVTADGDLYPCSSFVGIEEFCMGNVYDGLDREKQRMFLDLVVDRIEACRDCWARYFCGGGCYHQSYLTNGRIDEPDRAWCELVRHLIKLGGWMLSEVAGRPDLMEKVRSFLAGQMREKKQA